VEKMKLKKKDEGFSLLELSVVLLVIGMLLSIASFSYVGMLKSSEQKQTLYRISEVQSALLTFVVTNHRLPCADVDGNGYEGSGSPGVCGQATVSKAGTLPYKTLFMDSEPLDGSHQAFRYGVYRNGLANADLTTNLERTGDSVSSEKYKGLGDFLKALELAEAAVTLNTQIYVTGDGVRTGAAQCALNVVGNVAYALISGGYDDLDGLNGYWDAPNGMFGVGNYCVASPSSMQTVVYDDVVAVESFASLRGKLLALAAAL